MACIQLRGECFRLIARMQDGRLLVSHHKTRDCLKRAVRRRAAQSMLYYVTEGYGVDFHGHKLTGFTAGD